MEIPLQITGVSALERAAVGNWFTKGSRPGTAVSFLETLWLAKAQTIQPR